MDDEFYALVDDFWNEAARTLYNYIDRDVHKLPLVIKEGHRIAFWCEENGIQGATDLHEVVDVLEQHARASLNDRWAHELVSRERLQQVGDRAKYTISRIRRKLENRPTPLDTPEAAILPLEKDHLTILRYVRNNPGCKMTAIRMRALFTDRQVRRMVPELLDWNLLCRPRGRNSGHFITEPGDRELARANDDVYE